MGTGYRLLSRLKNTVYYCVEIQTLCRKKGLHTERLEPLVTERDKNKTRLTIMGAPYSVEGVGRCDFKKDL